MVSLRALFTMLQLRQVVVSKQQTFDESKNDLSAEVLKTRIAQNEHFTVQMPTIFQVF